LAVFDVTQLPPLEYKNKTYKIELHDTVSRGDYDEIRPKQYPGTNLILICFAVISPASYRNVKLRWIPEVEIYQPRAPILLVGLKQDLREDRDTLQKLTEKGEIAITKQMGEDTAKEIGAVDYIEYSGPFRHPDRF
jgi:Ras-related C3 botulinum toxin substrate 1